MMRATLLLLLACTLSSAHALQQRSAHATTSRSFKHQLPHDYPQTQHPWYTALIKRALLAAWNITGDTSCQYPSLECDGDVTVPRSIQDDVNAGRYGTR